MSPQDAGALQSPAGGQAPTRPGAQARGRVDSHGKHMDCLAYCTYSLYRSLTIRSPDRIHEGQDFTGTDRNLWSPG